MNFTPVVRSTGATQDLLRGILLLGALVALAFVLALLPLGIAGGATLGAIVLLLVLARPWLGLPLLLLAIPFGSPFNFQLGGFNLGPTEALFAVSLAVWLAHKAVARESAGNQTHRVGIPTIAYLLSFVLFAFALTLTVTHSLPDSLKELVKWFEVLTLVLLVGRSLTREHVILMLALIFVSGAVESVIGLYQTYTRNGPEPFFVPLGNQIIMRSYSTFEQPNPFAAYLNYALALITALLISFVFERWSRSFRSASWLLVLALGTLPLIGAALFFSLSRGAWLGYALAFVVMAALQSRRAFAISSMLVIVALGVLILGSLNVLPPAIAERLADLPALLGLNLIDPRAIVLTNENFALIDRMAHWYAAWNMFVDHPWLGVGIGNFAVMYPAYALREWPLSLGHAHNFYLNILAEAGLIGATFYVLFVLSSIVYAWWTTRHTQGIDRAIALGILGALIATAAHNFFDNLYVHGMNMQMAMLIGTLAVLKREG